METWVLLAGNLQRMVLVRRSDESQFVSPDVMLISKNRCMQCKLNRCPANSSIKVERCNRSDSRQQFFFDSGRIRSRKNPRVCLNRDGRSIILKPCSTSRHQKWAQLSKSDEFQLRIPGRSDKCASQHHWPRTGERVYMTSCKRSRTSQTDKWIAY